VDQLSVYGVLLKYLWCNCLCHLWWHRQLGVFVIQRSAVVVFVDQLSVYGVLLKYLWCICLCHLWWHRQLGVFVIQLSVPPLVAQAFGSQKLYQHRQFGIYVGNLFGVLLLAQTVAYCKVS
jgi:hypothetical protein